VQIVLDCAAGALTRGLDLVGQHKVLPSTSSAPSSRQTRSESSTVVMPLWPACRHTRPRREPDPSRPLGAERNALISLMDHTPGHRQFRDVEKLRTYYRGKAGGLTDAQLDVVFAKRHAYHAANAERHRRELVALATRNRTPLACHDDTTMEHVAESIADGAAIGSFQPRWKPPRGCTTAAFAC